MRSIPALKSKVPTVKVIGLTWRLLSLLILFAPSARADAGVGMLMVMSVPMWAILLLLIIPLEARIAKAIFGLSFKNCLKISTLANLASTVAGILVTCASLLCYEMFWYNNPYSFWIVPVNELVWCIPCFYLSVWIEGMVAARMVAADLKTNVHQWATKANLASYSILVTLLLGLLIWSVVSYFQMANSDDFCDVDRISADRVWQAQYNHMRDGTGHFRKRKTPRNHWNRAGKPTSWLKEECIKGYEAYDPLSAAKEIAILDTAIKKYDHEAPTQTKLIPMDDLFCTLSELADCYDREKRFAEAKYLRIRCLKLYYQDTTNLRLADEYAELGEFAAAKKIYKKLAELDDTYCRGHALIGLANVAEKQKQSAQSESYFQKAKQVFLTLGRDFPEYEEFCARLAQFYISENRYSDAESMLLQEIQYSDDHSIKGSLGPWPNAVFLLALSDCYYAQGNYPKAEHCLKQAMRGYSALPRATKKLAEYYQKRNIPEEATKWQQRAKDTAIVEATIE